MSKDLKELQEMFGMEQELDIPIKDRFYKTLTEEEVNNLMEVKNYPSKEVKEKIGYDIEALEAKIAELKNRI